MYFILVVLMLLVAVCIKFDDTSKRIIFKLISNF